MAKIRTVIRYERDGFIEGSDLEFKNKLLVRENDESYPAAFSTVINGQEGTAIYSNTERFELDPEIIHDLSAKLRSTYQSIPEINPESNLGSEVPERDDLESNNLNNNRYTSLNGRREPENRFWVKNELYGGDEDWNSSWSGVETPEFYKEIIGDGFKSSQVTKLEAWTRDLEEPLLEQLRNGSYSMFQDISSAITEIAEERDIDPLEAFKSFYDGNLSHEHDYYVLLGGEGGSETMTLTDPSKQKLRESIGFFDPSVVKHLHNGREDNYFEDEIEKLENEDEVAKTVKKENLATTGNLIRHLQENKGLELVNGALTVANSTEELKDTIERELNQNDR